MLLQHELFPHLLNDLEMFVPLDDHVGEVFVLIFYLLTVFLQLFLKSLSFKFKFNYFVRTWIMNRSWRWSEHFYRLATSIDS